MYVNCINCGHKFDIGKSYDDYEGPVRCPTCRAMLTIRTQDGNIRAVRPGLVNLDPPVRQQAPQQQQHQYQHQQPAQPQADHDAQDNQNPSIEVDFSPVRRNAA